MIRIGARSSPRPLALAKWFTSAPQAPATVLIAGGGIAGLCSAHRILSLSPRTEVTILDKCDSVAQGASGKNGGLLCPSLAYPWTSTPVIDLQDAFRNDDEPARGLFPSMITATDFPVRFDATACSSNPALVEFASKWVQIDPTETPIRRLMVHSMSLYNSPPLNSLEYNRTAKGTIPFGESTVSTSDSSGDIKLFCEGLKTMMETEFSSRFNILTSKRISSISTIEGGAVEHLEMSDGSFMHADKYVIAAGTSSRALLASAGVTCPTVAVKGYLMTFKSSTRIEQNLALSNKTFVSPLKFDEDRGEYQYRASGFAEFEGEQTEWEGKANKTLSCDDRSALDSIRGIMEEKFADLDVVDEDYGFRCLSPDDRPLIGRTCVSNLYVNTGAGSKGWTMGAGGGMLTAELLLGLTPSIGDPSPYDPRRFEGLILKRKSGSMTSSFSPPETKRAYAS